MAGIHSQILRDLENEDPVLISDNELIEAFQRGDATAGNKLFIKHHRMVLKIVLEITNGRWFDDDCFHAGAVGMYEAVKRFDTSLGYTFLTYAVPWIKKYVYLEACNAVLPAGGVSFSRDFKCRLYRFVGFRMIGLTDEEIKCKMYITDSLFKLLDSAASQASRPTTLTMAASDLYADSETDEEVPTPGLPSVLSAEEMMLEKEAINYFLDIIESINDDTSEIILKNILFEKIDEALDITRISDIIGNVPLNNEEMMAKLNLVNKRELFALRRKAYRLLRKALASRNEEDYD